MTTGERSPLRDLDEDAALRTLVEGTATETGERFFAALVDALARALDTQGAWVTEFLEESCRLRALAFRMGGEWIDDYEYDIAGTPCELVVREKRLVHYPENVVALFPEDPDLEASNAVSFMGAPLIDADGRVLGHLAVLDSRPLPEDPRCLALIQIFAARAAAELQRLRAESATRKREGQLRRLVDGAMDAIIELDRDLGVVLMNPSAEKAFECRGDEVLGRDVAALLSEDSRSKLTRLVGELDERAEGEQSLWIAGGLAAAAPAGSRFPAEATLSRSELGGRVFYTLILRNVNERMEAEARIRSLSSEAEYLREEIRSLQHFDEIVGQSKALGQVLRDVGQVAETDATVLIQGETGTGKELIAHAIHAAGARREKPLIKVNCAAVAANLIESEFFGHVKGAFTGATHKREGRFALADGGTLFLDEVGELPLDLQSKLLRVLQEGEFEPVGGSQTLRVDVRVIAATNRDLAQAVGDGAFREDLFYRLNVFPIQVPPLRERREDIPALATTFARTLAQKMGRRVEPLSRHDVRRLQAYPWPGNVRELQNVIERALITSPDGRLDLDRALPEAGAAAGSETSPPTESAGEQIYTAEELQSLERSNIVRALESSGWKVAGERGAARLLGINPSTLSSRMKALGIRRER
jgi:PAS domain S-box-containing protein